MRSATGERTYFARWLDEPSPDGGLSFFDRGRDAWSAHSYAQLAHRVAGASWGVSELTDPADRVLLIGETSVELVVAWFACASAGVSPLIVAPPGFESATDLAARVERAAASVGARCAIVSGAVEAALGDAPVGVPLLSLEELADQPDVSDRDRCVRASPLAFVQLTSGTSGTPRPVGVTADALGENLRAVRHWLQLGPDDSGSSWLPLYHDLGLVGSLLNATTAQMSASFMSPESFLARPDAWLETLAVHGSTISASPTFALAYCLRNLPKPIPDHWDLSAWRVLCLGGERVDARMVVKFLRRLADHGLDPSVVTPAYGMAEATVCVSGARVDLPARMLRLPRGPITPDVIGSAEAVALDAAGLEVVDADTDSTWIITNGPSLDGVGVTVRSLDGDDTDEGLGELVVTTPSTGVAVDPTGFGPLDAHRDGVLATGDSGFLHDGEIFVLGRIGEACKVRGRLVHAEDVETDLADDARTRRFRGCVIMGALETTQEVVLVLERKLGPDELVSARAVARRRTGGEVPVHVALLQGERVPRTTSGKPRRGELWTRRLQGTLALLEEAGP